MQTLRSSLLTSLFLLILIGVAAWPVYVAVNYAISFVIGEGSVIDIWNQEPKRNIITEFISGYKLSAPFAAVIALLAAIDYQLLSKYKLTGFFAGILIPVGCIAIAFKYYPEPAHVLPGFVLTGLALWFLYKLVDIGLRLTRVSK